MSSLDLATHTIANVERFGRSRVGDLYDWSPAAAADGDLAIYVSSTNLWTPGKTITSDITFSSPGALHIDDNVNIFLGSGDDTDLSFDASIQAFVIGAPTPRMQFRLTGPPIIRFIGNTEIDQNSAGTAEAPLTLDQANQNHVILKIIATSHPTLVDKTLTHVDDFPTLGAFAGCVQIEIEDTRAGGFTDGDFYMALYDAPTTPLVLSTFAQVTKTATYTITASDVIVFANGTFTLTLPTAVGVPGKIYYIMNIGTGTITVEGDGSEEINGSLNQTLAQNEAMTPASDNVAWWIL